MGSLRRTAGRDSNAVRNIALAAGVILVVGFLAGGFAGGLFSGGGPETGAPKTLEQLAATTGCKPQIFENQGLRQGRCKTAQGDFTLVTFKQDTGRRTWLKEARNAGGKPAFLVGTRWVIIGTDNPKSITMLEGFRDKLGGEVQAASQS